MPGPEREGIDRRRLAVFALAAIAARAVTFGNPILHTDEEFYLVVARAILAGAMPYVDIWDRKPIGLFAIYLIPALFPLKIGVLAYQAMALAAVVATAALIARLATRIGWGRGGLAAGLLYIVWLDLADGQGGQAPVFYNAVMVAAVVLVARPVVSRRRGFAAMALVGLAIQIKYSVVFESIAIGLWLILRDRDRDRGRGWLRYGLALCVVALLPTALVAGAFYALGAGSAFLYANALSILARHPDPVAERLDNLRTAAAILVPLLGLASASWFAAPATSQPMRPVRNFLFAWLGAALFGFAVFGSWFNHYTLPVMVPASACAAGLFARRRTGRLLAAIVLGAGFVGGQIVLQAERRARGTPAQFANLVRAIGPGPGTLYVYSGSAMLYPATGRRALSRYVLPSHLHLARERGAIGADQRAEIARIFARRPDMVVTQAPLYDEAPDTAALVRAEIARGGYAAMRTVPVGRYTLAVYRRATSRPFPPAAR